MRGRMLVIVTMVAGLLFAASLSWAREGNGQRQRKQIQRIGGGLRSGEITQREFRSLCREQWRTRQTIGKAFADGRVNAREKGRIHYLQDRASRHIYGAKHNSARRYGWRPVYRYKNFRQRSGYRPCHKCYGYGPPTYGYHFKGSYAQPYYSFAFSIGWW